VVMPSSECSHWEAEGEALVTSKLKGELATSASLWSTCSLYDEETVMAEEKVKELEERVRGKRVEGDDSKYASNSSSGWVVGLEKESKGDRVRAKREPAVRTFSNSASQDAGSVGAGATVIWKAP